MALKEIKVDKKTLEQIDDIIVSSPEGKDLIQKRLVETIDKLWAAICQPENVLVLIDETPKEISPKPEYLEIIKTITDKKGPYIAIKTYKSWSGLSEGVYQLKDCTTFVPASWFTTAKIERFSLQTILIIGFLLSLLQNLILLLVIFI